MKCEYLTALITFSANHYKFIFSPNKCTNFFHIGLCRIYESVQINKKKKELGSKEGKVDYELTDLLKFLDSLQDLSALVFNEKVKGYSPHGREWLKAKIYKYLKDCAGEK